MATYLTNSKVHLCKIQVNCTYTLWQVSSNFFSDEAHDEYDNWICIPTSRRSPKDVAYGEAYMKYSPVETSVQFRKFVNMVPWDILRYVRF